MSKPLFNFKSYIDYIKALYDSKSEFFNLHNTLVEDIEDGIEVKESNLKLLMRLLRKWKNLSNLNK